jgi:DNA-binding LacI/PurR family transcriptional regulator
LRYQGQSNIYAVEQRYHGYREAVRQELGADQTLVIKDRDYLAAIDALDLSQDRTAILCSSDIFALRVLNHLQAKGVSVPGDVGLMGFDNIDTLQFVRPRLATVDYHIHDIGHLAFDLLLRQIDGEPSASEQTTTVRHQIVSGATL